MSMPLAKEEEEPGLKVLIIDDDSSVLTAVGKVFRGDLFQDVKTVEDSREAWEIAKAAQFHLIIMDWKLNRLSGLALLNRFKRHSYYRNIPIIIITGFLDQKNLGVMSDFLYISFLQKPFEEEKIISVMESALNEVRWISEKKSSINGIINAIYKSTDDESVASQIISLAKEAPNQKMTVAIATLLVETGRFEEAEKILKIALKQTDTSIIALNELAKLYYRQGKIKESHKLFKRAGEINLGNIERLLLLGSISLEEMNPEEAKIHFEKVLSIDEDDQTAKAGMSIVSNISELISQKQTIPSTLPSLLNSIGISYVISKNTKDGVKHYKAALGFVRDTRVKAKLAFNIGYAFKRAHDHENALVWFRKALGFDPSHEKSLLYSSETYDAQSFDVDNFEDFITIDESSSAGINKSLKRSNHSSLEDFGKNKEEPLISKEEFVALCPSLDAYLAMSSDAGIYLDVKINDIYRIYKFLGAEVFNERIEKMLNDKNPSLSALKNGGL